MITYDSSTKWCGEIEAEVEDGCIPNGYNNIF